MNGNGIQCIRVCPRRSPAVTRRRPRIRRGAPWRHRRSPSRPKDKCRAIPPVRQWLDPRRGLAVRYYVEGLAQAGRPHATVRFRDVRPPTRLRPVAPRLHPTMQIQEIRLQVPSIVVPRHPVHPRRGLRADRPIRPPEPRRRDMVQQRGEPRVLVPSCHLTHTAQRTRRIGSGTGSGMRFAVRVPLRLTAPFPPPPPRPWPCSAGSQVLRSDPTSHARASQAYHLVFPERPSP